MFAINYRIPIWSDVRVRQALLYAVDRAAIVKDVTKGTAVVAPCYDPFPQYWPADANPYAYDPAKAKELLKAAGYDTSQKVEVPTYYTDQFNKDTLAAVQSYLAAVGINVEYQFMDAPAWRNIVEATDPKYALAYRGAGQQIAFMDTQYLFSNGRPTWTKGSYYGWNDPKLDGLLNAMLTAKPEDYKAARTAVCEYMNQNATLGFMWVANRYGVASASVKNFSYYPAAATIEDHSEKWTMK